MRTEEVLHLPLLNHGRTFICGDIHGCFSMLEDELAGVQFDIEKDRLICVGDLIDRGPDSIRALEFLEKSWFYSVMGNHELMLVDILSGDKSMESAWLYEGGTWFYDQVPKMERKFWKDKLSNLPIIIEVETEAGLVGIVHADLPKEVDWSKFVGLIKEGDPVALSKALRSRVRVNSGYCEQVNGVWRIYCGHTRIAKPRLQGNVYCIDTGAYLGSGYGALTLMEIAHGKA